MNKAMNQTGDELLLFKPIGWQAIGDFESNTLITTIETTQGIVLCKLHICENGMAIVEEAEAYKDISLLERIAELRKPKEYIIDATREKIIEFVNTLHTDFRFQHMIIEDENDESEWYE